MLATYHNHTRWSDGKATSEALFRRATDLGIHELGISDHFVLRPDGRPQAWGMPVERLGDYVEEVRSFRTRRGPVVRLGLEVDWFPGQARTLRAALEPHPFDYLIGSVHDVHGFPIDSNARPWEQVTADERDEVHRRYWQQIRAMAESRLFDIAAHLDLSKKFGYFPTIDLSREIGAALDAIADADMVVELNTAGWHKPCKDGYPTVDILKGCHERGIAVTISADAHEPDHLLRDFDRAAERLRAAGYTEVARFADRQRRLEPIDEAVPA